MWPGIILTLHGAGVDAKRQAACYQPKVFAHVCRANQPSNRMALTGKTGDVWTRLKRLPTHNAPSARTLANSGSLDTPWVGMAHGNSLYSDRTSSPRLVRVQDGEVSSPTAPSDPKSTMLSTRYSPALASPSDTLLLKDNLMRPGVYVLHGDKDDNVPVEEARAMREALLDHADLEYHEQEGAGHWWGNECV